MHSTSLKIRLCVGDMVAIGPGKADLLEAISQHGSISAAGRAMGMSYKRAWDLVHTMNACFCEPVIVTTTGGSHGGGARLSDFGQTLLADYRDMEARARAVVALDIEKLAARLAKS